MTVLEDEDYVPPFQNRYFSADMMAKYEPLAEAVARVEQSEGQDEAAFSLFEEHWARFMDFSWCSQWDGKKYDIVFYGVSGYTGYLMMEYLKRSALKRRESFTFAFAGRSATKVAEMRDREFAGTEWAETPILTASFDDVVSIIDIVKSAHVIVNCAGPYMLTEGEVLIDACVWCKTDYVDISMEIPWTLRLKELHRYALEAGVMIVPSCAGTAYSDLGVMMLAKKIREDYGEETRTAVCYCSGGGSAVGPSGGMLRTRAALAQADPSLEQARADPFSLGGFIPEFDRNGFKVVDVQAGTGIVTARPREEDRDATMTRVTEDRSVGVWRAPYVHAFFDTRVVRRSNMLQADLGGRPYGSALNFTEHALLPAEKAAAARREAGDEPARPFGQYGIALDEEESAVRGAGREFKDGQGPQLGDMAGTWSAFFLYAESPSGNRAQCSFVGSDGYFETARVAIETARTLRFDRQKLPFPGGVLTPSTAGATCLLERLIESGVKFKMGAWHDRSETSPPSIA